MSAAQRWPARRADLTAQAEESANIPGTFEPVETLGDTWPAPLDSGRMGMAVVSPEDEAAEATRIPRWMLWLGGAAFFAAVFWPL